MEKVNEICNHPIYMEYLSAIELWEKDRVYCGHGLEHFLDVARIGYILILEQGLDVTKEVVYGYGLLHDLGRAEQYATGEPHDIASVRLAKRILEDTSYTEAERYQIIEAIKHHRDDAYGHLTTFEGLMYKADKASRACYSCKAADHCNWSHNKKNKRIEV